MNYKTRRAIVSSCLFVGIFAPLTVSYTNCTDIHESRKTSSSSFAIQSRASTESAASAEDHEESVTTQAGGLGTMIGDTTGSTGGTPARPYYGNLYWMNFEDRNVGIWQLHGFNVLNASLINRSGRTTVAPDWRIVGTGDFDGDGKPDLLWFNSQSRKVAIWKMDGSRFNSGRVILHDNPSREEVNAGWEIRGVADFDDDRKADILWFNTQTRQVAIWKMDGFNLTEGSFLKDRNGIAEGWDIKGVGDFFGDGGIDILLFNSSSRNVAIWKMNGTNLQEGQTIVHGGQNAVAPGWAIQGVGDFDHDGKADILWMNEDNRNVAIWKMNGFSLSEAQVIVHGGRTPVLPGWRIKGIHDLTGDGKADIVWFNDRTHAVAIWEMNGFSLIDGQVIELNGREYVNSGWDILSVGPN